MTDLDALRAAYVEQLRRQGIIDVDWLRAFHTVPREVFVPRFFRQAPDGRWQGVDASCPHYWTHIYSDRSLVTQLDKMRDPDPHAEPVAGIPSSSSSQPSLMAYMLDALSVTGRERVLEIGTGTGYNAALMAHRLGEDAVTTVEIDPTITERARRALAQVGFSPAVHVSDGRDGWPDAGPYDRIIATCSVAYVPLAWLHQTTEGGHIVVSLWRPIGSPLVRLTVHDGVAYGRFLPTGGSFMPARAHPILNEQDALRVAVNQDGHVRETAYPCSILDEDAVALWIGLHLPDVHRLGLTPVDGDEQLWLFAPDGSWSMVDVGKNTVEQYGPRRLWDDVERANAEWERAGRPARDHIGLTVTRSGDHQLTIDDAS
jgi:Protein-L-isoaspartate carboxylmethyltransferase